VWEDLGSIAWLPPELRHPRGLLGYLYALPIGLDRLVTSEVSLRTFQLLTEVLLFLGIIGWRTRVVIPLGALCYFLLLGILIDYSFFWHQNLLPLYVMIVLSFTPCVFPMFPILSGIIAKGGQHITKQRGFILALAYVLGMAITYAIAGVAAGLSGAMLSATLQNAWVLGAFALIFVTLAFSMFGFYELQLPTFFQSKISEEAGHLKGGHLTSVFGMGALSALIVGPCVAAPLAGALLYISQTHDVVLGGSALFAMALGMGLPLLLLGASAGALLPKAGAWMEGVKQSFGVLLLGVAIWLISPVIPAVSKSLSFSARNSSWANRLKFSTRWCSSPTRTSVPAPTIPRPPTRFLLVMREIRKSRLEPLTPSELTDRRAGRTKRYRHNRLWLIGPKA